MLILNWIRKENKIQIIKKKRIITDRIKVNYKDNSIVDIGSQRIGQKVNSILSELLMPKTASSSKITYMHN